MEEELRTGICGGRWWNATKGGVDVSSVAAGATGRSASVSDVGGFSWSAAEAMEAGKGARSCENPVATASGVSSSTFQEAPRINVSDPMACSGYLLESTIPMVDFSQSPIADWSQALLRSSGRLIKPGGFQAMLQEDLNTRPYFGPETGMEAHQIRSGSESMNLLKGSNNGFILEQSSQTNPETNPVDYTGHSFSGVSASLGCPPSLLQSLLDQEIKPQRSSYDNLSTNFASPVSFDRLSSSDHHDPTKLAWSKFPELLKASPPKQLLPPPMPPHQLHFSNNAPLWDPSAAAVADARTDYSLQVPFFPQQKFEEKPISCNATTKCSPDNARESSSGGKKRGNEPAFKKSRIETPSPLPAFKVRKEKLGDRITALQQLVAPFGKTDTASVLQEAIEYIKFLHEQVLCTPYLKNGSVMQQQQQQNPEQAKQDLRSRGLCLVPISSTFAVANEPLSDFWTPTFGSTTYR